MNIDGNKMNNERSTTRGKGRDTSKSALQLTKTKELRIFLKKISSLLGENGLGPLRACNKAMSSSGPSRACGHAVDCGGKKGGKRIRRREE